MKLSTFETYFIISQVCWSTVTETDNIFNMGFLTEVVLDAVKKFRVNCTMVTINIKEQQLSFSQSPMQFKAARLA